MGGESITDLIDECYKADQRIETLEAEVERLREKLEHIYTFAAGAKLFPTHAGFSKIQVISNQALKGVE